MKRLYRKMTKRLAKKRLGGWRWRKLQYGLALKPGDLVSTCKGYNERITEITPRWRQRVVIDFDIVTESGSSCSLLHCCTFPLETRDQIVAYWLAWPQELADHYGWGHIGKALRDGKEVFDVDGQPTYEYCNEWERKARFPERTADGPHDAGVSTLRPPGAVGGDPPESRKQ